MLSTGLGGCRMSGKRVLWRDRCDERVRDRRRRQAWVMAALAQAGAVADAEAAAEPNFDLCAWLMLGSAGEGAPAGEPPIQEP